jgi:N-acetylmuramoyl-L-alanine amidase
MRALGRLRGGVWALMAGCAFLSPQASCADEGSAGVILAIAGARCQVAHAVLAGGELFLRLSDVAACRGGSAQLVREDATIVAEMDGRRLTIWPWGEPIAVLNGLDVVPLPPRPWLWHDGGFYLNAELVETWLQTAVGMRFDPSDLPLHYDPGPGRVDPGRARWMRHGLRVMVDPGHGGPDEGARAANGVPEKQLTLDIGVRLAAILLEMGFDVRLTREADVYPTLRDRVVAANSWDADLFVSLHLNSAPRKTARGVETYVLGRQASDSRAQELAQFENAYDGVQAQGDATLDQLLADVARLERENMSVQLAAPFHARLAGALDTENRGVRRAPFFVLVGATMPAFLVELGFISNAEEAALLQTPDYQIQLARAMAVGIESIAPYLARRRGTSATDAEVREVVR